jgi:hypothetical protein
MTNTNRQPKGQTNGGEFAPDRNPEPVVDLGKNKTAPNLDDFQGQAYRHTGDQSLWCPNCAPWIVTDGTGNRLVELDGSDLDVYENMAGKQASCCACGADLV